MEITNLIPHISILKDYLIFNDGNSVDDSMTAEKSMKTLDTMRSRAMLLEQLPYFLNSSYFFILQIFKFQLTLIETKLNNISDSSLHNLTSSERDPIAFMTDSFFNSARRAQDAIIPYISRSFSLSLPNSMNELMKKLHKGEISLPTVIKELLKIYWDSHGKKIKAYRDLGQHHALISSEGWVAKPIDGSPLIHLSLPNNPEEKNTSRLRYDDPVILALPYLTIEFQYLLQFIFKVTDLLLPSEINRDRTSHLVIFRNPKIGKHTDMHQIQDEKPFVDEVKQYLQQLSIWSEKHRLVERPPLDPKFKINQ